MHIECRGKRRDLHVVGPFARLAHFLNMLFKLLLQLFFCIVCGVDACWLCSGGGAFRISSQVVHSHVLSVKFRVIPHVLDGGLAEERVHFLVAVKLIRQSIEQAVALHTVSGEHGEK